MNKINIYFVTCTYLVDFIKMTNVQYFIYVLLFYPIVFVFFIKIFLKLNYPRHRCVQFLFAQ